MAKPAYKPTAAERAAALKVVKYYNKKVDVLTALIDQERVYEWSRGLEVVTELLVRDPERTFKEYLEEYSAGHP